LPFLFVVTSFRPAAAVGLYILVALAILILICLITLVEAVTLQLLGWGNTRQSIRASLAMNVPSSVAGIILLVLFPQPNLRHLLIAWPILVIIEAAVLSRLRPQTLRYDWFTAVVANLASYLLLVLPAFLFRG
jgi:hypothetical protein